MKAYLIDPFTKNNSTNEFSGYFDDLYGLLDCELYDIYENGKSVIYVDDSGLLDDLKQQESV